MSLEQIGILSGVIAAFVSLITPLIRLNGLLSRLNTLLDDLSGRTLRCEERLDAHDKRLSRNEAELAALRESVRQAHHRLDEINKELF